MIKGRTYVFLDIAIGEVPAGRIVFELFDNINPRTSENFRGLCTGEYGQFKLDGKQKNLHYLNTSLFTVFTGQYILGGDISYDNGNGGHSIYGLSFNDENFTVNHTERGLLSMVNRGKNNNNSQFRVSLGPLPQFNHKEIVFGKLVYGNDVLTIIEKTKVDKKYRPKELILIVNCGELGDTKDFMSKDPLSLAGMKRIRDANKYNRLYFEQIKNEDDQNKDNEISSSELEIDEKKKLRTIIDSRADVIEHNLAKRNLSEIKDERLAQIKQRIADIKTKNIDAVYKEEKILEDPEREKKLRAQKYATYKEDKVREQDYKNISGLGYLDKPMHEISRTKQDEKNSKKEVFGWDGKIKSIQCRFTVQSS